LLICAALTVTAIAPARAGTSAEPGAPVTQANLPKIPIPDLIDPNGQPILTQPVSPEPQPDATDDPSDTAQPAIDRTENLASMVEDLRGPDAGSTELECLATGIYFESKSEPLAGQLAVGKVIANRANSGGRFPSTYCGVLFQHGQFSFIHGRSLPHVAHSNHQWQTAVAIAKIVDQGLKDAGIHGALFFHARYVSPGWHLKRVASIGNHIFFR
jgi:N-acetylmuramoyl-L-alanine amidase